MSKYYKEPLVYFLLIGGASEQLTCASNRAHEYSLVAVISMDCRNTGIKSISWSFRSPGLS